MLSSSIMLLTSTYSGTLRNTQMELFKLLYWDVKWDWIFMSPVLFTSLQFNIKVIIFLLKHGRVESRSFSSIKNQQITSFSDKSIHDRQNFDTFLRWHFLTCQGHDLKLKILLDFYPWHILDLSEYGKWGLNRLMHIVN